MLQVIAHLIDVLEVLRLDDLTAHQWRIYAHLQQLLPPTAIRILFNQLPNELNQRSEGRPIEPGIGGG